jgi:hypothetical protein
MRRLWPGSPDGVSEGASVPDEFDGAIEWDATLVQPQHAILFGSSQPLVVQIAAPVVLDDQTVEFLLGGTWRRGTWMGEPGHERSAVLPLGEFVARGSKAKVLVRVHAGQYVPVLEAGSFRVR